MKQRTKQLSSKPRVTLALLAAAVAVTCAKAEDATPGATGAGGSDGAGPTSNSTTGTSLQNTTTSSTASGTTAATTSAASSANSGTSSGTTGGGDQGGAAGAPGDTSTDGTGGTGGEGSTGTGGTSTTGVPPDVIENAEIVLLYKIDSAQATTASIFMHLYLRNQSDDDFPLGESEVRYWLDDDGRNYTMASHYQGPGIGPITLGKGTDGDDEYVAVTFEAGATLDANTIDLNRNEFQVKLDAAGGNFDQTNDYSYAPSLTSTTEHDRITVYLAGELIWGCEPSGTCAGDDPGAGGAGGAAGAAGAEG